MSTKINGKLHPYCTNVSIWGSNFKITERQNRIILNPDSWNSK